MKHPDFDELSESETTAEISFMKQWKLQAEVWNECSWAVREFA